MQTERLLTFGPYWFDSQTGQLWRGKQEVSLTGKAVAVLRYLVERSGQVVTKDELFQAVWADTVVSDAALSSCIQELRQALRDNAKQPRYIATVYRRGFQFIAEVQSQEEVASSQHSVASRPEQATNEPEVSSVMPANTGIQEPHAPASDESPWIPASAGMTPLPSPHTHNLPPRPEQTRALPFPRSVVLAAVLLLTATIVLVQYLSRSSLSPQPSALVPQSLTPNLQSLPLPDKPSIAVMPFTNMSGDPTQEYFSDGLTDDLITALSRLSQLFVIARHSVFTYKGKAVKVQEVSKELGVQYLLEGSVQKADGQVRINAQLVDATTGRHLWAERYDRPFTDIFALQDEIVQKTVFALKVKLTPEEQKRFKLFPTDNLEAYDSVLRGLEPYLRFTKEGNIQGRQLFEKAIALDPRYAGAYAWLGWTYVMEWFFHASRDPRQELDQALVLAQRARILDDSVPDVHQLLAWVYLYKNQPEQALAEAEHALALDPNYADSYHTLAHILNIVGRPQEAIGMAEKALRLDPRGPMVTSNLLELSAAYRSTGRAEEAIATNKHVFMLDPNSQFAYTNLAFTYVWAWAWQSSQDQQMLEEALAAAQKALALNDSFPWAHTALGAVYLLQKQPDQALTEAKRVIALDPTLPDGYGLLAATLNAVGKPEEALGVAEKAVHLGSSNPFYLFEVGHAYCLSGRYEEAMSTLKQFISRAPNILHAQLFLALAASEAGREEEARTAAAEVLQINPNFSLEVHRQRATIKDPAVLERHIAALRKAGLK